MGVAAAPCLFIRLFQTRQDHGVLSAVFIFLLAAPVFSSTVAAETRQASINSNGVLATSDKLVRRERSRDKATATANKSVTRGDWLPSFLKSDAEKEMDIAKGNSADNSAKADDWLSHFRSETESEKPTPPPTEYLMFSGDGGGSWDGARNDIAAEVGFEFKALKDLNITAIGRHVAGRWDQRNNGGINLFAKAEVTLWFVPTANTTLPKHMNKNWFAPNGLKLLTVEVGPDDIKAVGGKYMFKELEKPFQLNAHHSYRITQSCWIGMDDVWFDGVADISDLDQYSLTECVKIGNGVHSVSRYRYPDMLEHKGRRAGMLNMMVKSQVPCGVALPKVPEDLETPGESTSIS